MPGLMARMLEALDVADSMRVLEIGTGTGYNAALLSHRLGDDHVVSIDIDPDLVEQARGHIAGLGLHPTLLAGNGSLGAAEHAPFDRIIATAAVPAIPPDWIRQLRPGGTMLVNLRGDLVGDLCCLLTRHGNAEHVSGPFLPIGGNFMWLRPELDETRPAHEVHRARHTRTTYTTTRFDPRSVPVYDPGFRFLLQMALPGCRRIDYQPAYDPAHGDEREALVVSAADGARVEVFTALVPHGDFRVRRTRPMALVAHSPRDRGSPCHPASYRAGDVHRVSRNQAAGGAARRVRMAPLAAHDDGRR